MTALPRFSSLLDSWALALGVSTRFLVTLLLSMALHSMALFGLHFKAPDWDKTKSASRLDVVLVNSKSAKRPNKADSLAQANLDGGGNTDEKRRAASPLPTLEQEQSRSELSEKTGAVKQLEREAQALMTQLKSKALVDQPDPNTVTPEGRPENLNAAELRQRSLDAARLEARIDRDWDRYQERPKRKYIGARTQEYRFARYVEDWRIKVERVGNLNYPDEARRNKIYGSLALTVSIKANGEVEKVEVDRSSGHKVLDEAAIRVVRLAAPYAAFPDDIRRDTDIVSITRVWMFTKGDQLATEF
ncbi:MAG: energy transducer TonB [Sulfuricella sp.]|nr:energy transducer TonB [Sulfuricella sp.]